MKTKPALVVVDMQHRFLRCTNGGLVTANCVALIGRFHERGLPVYPTQHHDPDPDSLLTKWWNDPIHKESEDWQLLPEIAAALNPADNLIQEKTTYDSFLGTRLQTLLQEAEVTEVVICGCMTNLCCETTARSAFCRGYDVLFPRDANGTLTPEMQARSLANLEFGFATVCSTAEVLARLAPPDRSE